MYKALEYLSPIYFFWVIYLRILLWKKKKKWGCKHKIETLDLTKESNEGSS